MLGIETKLQINTEVCEHTVVNAGRKVSVRSTAELQRFKRHRFASPDGMQTYHVSIIDFLQLWNCNKKSEQFIKTKFLSANKAVLSAVEPEFYKARFQAFMMRKVFVTTRLVSRTHSASLILNSSVDSGRMTVLNRSITGFNRTTSLENSNGVAGHLSAPMAVIVEENKED